MPGATVERNSALPEKIPDGGLIILRDGHPGEPSQALGGFGNAYYQHAVEIEVYVEEGDAAARDAAFDALLQQIRAALETDPTLGDLVFGLTYGRPEPAIEAIAGAPAIKTATLIVSPTHGEQEGSAWNGHFSCTCYHPLFVFNQFGDLERCLLRPGNAHSAEDWRLVLEPVIARYRERGVALHFRADAAFAKPEIYELLEAEGIRYAIRLPANQVLQRRIGHLLTRPVGRPPKKPVVSYASFHYQADGWTRARRVVAKVEWHQGELYPRVGFIVTNLTRPNKRVVKFYNGRGTAEQHIKEGKNAIRWTRLSCNAFRLNAVRLQLHALAYNLANFLSTLALPEEVEQWPLTTLREKLVKIGARIVRHGRYVVFQLAEVAVRERCSQRSSVGARAQAEAISDMTARPSVSASPQERCARDRSLGASMPRSAATAGRRSSVERLVSPRPGRKGLSRGLMESMMAAVEPVSGESWLKTGELMPSTTHRAISNDRAIFVLHLIKPSHYDDDGYVIQWVRSDIPSNTLAALYGIARDCDERGVLGEGVEIRVSVHDETNLRIAPEKIIHAFDGAGGKGLVALVGVQSNQFPRAIDLARPLREAGIPVCIGGFHAAGSLAMLPEPPPELCEAWHLGISIFAGEAEGRLDEVLRDAYGGQLKPLYDYTSDLPSIAGVPGPFLARDKITRNMSKYTSFDAGRGCPFQCSFCTIINVQGRKSRYRTADDVEKIVRENYAQGIKNFFITDDNLARNRNWEQIFDRLIELREAEGIPIKLIIQVDTLCHRIANFIEKAGRAGAKRVFIGLENISPDNLIAAKKKQNRITEYRTMLQAWKSVRAITYCGYIIGFPNDTPERVIRDIEIIKRELPVDFLEFFCLTPLPGSEDHQTLHGDGVWMDPDLNKYDAVQVTTGHPLMSAEQWRDTYRRAWKIFYDPEHVETLMRRARACRIRPRKIAGTALGFYGSMAIEGVHPLEGGWLRRKYRKDRRPGLPIESPFLFYPRYAWETALKAARFAALWLRYRRIRRRVEADPFGHAYRDLALTPVSEDEVDELEIFHVTESAKQAVVKARQQRAQQRTLRPAQAAGDAA